MPQCAPEEYHPFGEGPEGVAPLAYFGSDYVFHVSSSMHDETGFPNSRPDNAARVIARLHRKVEDHRDELEMVRRYYLEEALYVVVSYGASSRAALATVQEARQAGCPVGLLQLLCVWPFPDRLISQLAGRAAAMLVAEMSYGQLRGEVERAAGGQTRVKGIHRFDGELLTPEEVLGALEEVAGCRF
ncbi:MAG TPA: hypothetical protein GX513_10065 [Firmicutes bacterium]|nr:hypothetical protein [Bacillota bacterium]